MLEILVVILSVLVVLDLALTLSGRRGGHADLVALIEKNQERTERVLREEFARSRGEQAARLQEFGQTLSSRMNDWANAQKIQLDLLSSTLAHLTEANEKRMREIRQSVETGLDRLREDNSKKLEQMRATVDEKLHATLEQRLGESFRLVSDRLELVHKGLGEMQTLASGVGDLKRVLTNIKTRGSWGEVQLGNLLEQMLTPDQYSANVAPSPSSSERVDFAIRLPGREPGEKSPVWLPIDAKFPQEDYQRLLDAQERGALPEVEEAARALEARIRLEARKIRDKYINPPYTTDFAIMFLPTEGLFAEVLRRPGLFETLQREFRVCIMGPTTLGAILNSLQMGFRTLAIEKRSSEVWSVLGAVKTEFAKFGAVLDKVQKKLHEASTTVEQAATRSRVLERRLRKVQDLPAEHPAPLELPSGDLDIKAGVS
ncbi:MAG TPA: DNA recombination protein RmuC [Acidobacteriota bacterium]|nr:DNA recombination protein RmuC [Acidobacteriota bacterium]